MANVDSALTLRGYVRGGRYKESTEKLYQAAWDDFGEWCSNVGRTALPATPETVAEYASWLVSSMGMGYTPGTARYRIAAIRSRHRQTGNPVPDNVPAWGVLHGREPTRSRATTQEVTRDTLIRASESCGSTHAGKRDRAIALLAWDLTVPSDDFVGIDVECVSFSTPGMTVRVGERDMVVDHSLPDNPVTCPVCALSAWVDALASEGIHNGPLFRPIDRLGVIGGNAAGRRLAGTVSASNRLSKRSLYRVWSRLVIAAGIEITTPYALRVGGARHRARRFGLVSAMDRAGWQVTGPASRLAK